VGKETGISWTDHTFNPWWGCTKVSPGCDNCYAETLDKRWGEPHWGKGVSRRAFGDKHWNEPLQWNQAACKAGVKRKVFCASMADVMDDEAPAGQRERLWGLIDDTSNLIWQLLTKRPTRYTQYLPVDGFKHNNVWLGTSAENQHFYDVRWSVLRIVCDDFDLDSFISYEPALGPLSILEFARKHEMDGHAVCPDWLICGAESGANRRPMEQKWAENIADECEITGTKFFMKQMGARTPEQGAQLIPAHLLIRQFPGGTE
jgi:protein gp37